MARSLPSARAGRSTLRRCKNVAGGGTEGQLHDMKLGPPSLSPRRALRNSTTPRRVPSASRKGRDRHSPRSRPGDPLASGGDALTGNAKSKEPRSIGDSLKDTLKSSDLRSVALICVTACFSLLVLQFVGSDETYAHFFPPKLFLTDPYWVLRVRAWWVLWK